MYSHVFVGGTFDHLHRGHQSMFTEAFAVGDHVTIGLTSDLFVERFRDSAQAIQPFTERKKRLAVWLSSHDLENRADIIAIDDPYEPAASMEDLDGLMVTRENRHRGEEINKRRVSKGLSELTLVEVPIVPAEDADPISSTRVRAGEIDATGKLIMPDALRPELVKPLGTVLTGDAIGTSIEKYRSGTIITVGDMTTKTLLTAGVVPNLMVVDFHVGRKPYEDNEAKFTELNLYRMSLISGPGYIANEAVETIQKWAKHPAEKMILAVTGEEDLLTLPAVAYGPVGAVVYYGQPAEAAWACGPTMHEGMVEVLLTPRKTNEAIALLGQFT